MQHSATGALVAPTTTLNPSELAALAYLGRYSGHTRKLYELHLRLFFEWCAQHQLDPLADVQRIHVELFVRHLEEDRGNVPSTIRNRMAAVKGYYRFAAIDGLITRNPAEYAHIPRAHRDDALDAGIPLRDVQILARHSDPRVTMQYDVARGNWDRHGVHILSAYVAGAA